MKEETLKKITDEAHKYPRYEEYESSETRRNTNCYSHAIGILYPSISIYRIGAISELKSIKEKYNSISEIIYLLKKDLDTLQLNYEIVDSESDAFELIENQYIIKLYVKIYANGSIGDYHFIRYENKAWTEKWRGYKSRYVDADYYEGDWGGWQKVITLKITR